MPDHERCHHRPRRGKRDKMTMASRPRHDDDDDDDNNKIDSDHNLSHFHRSCTVQHRPKPKREISDHHPRGDDGNNYLAFSSIDSSKHIEKTQNAGVSSAAACIILEMPILKSIPTRRRVPAGGYGSGGLDLLSSSNSTNDDSRKRRTNTNNAVVVSTKDVQKWRNTTSGACYRFKPVFTHQLFTDEIIKGYRPTDGAIEEAIISLRGSSSSSVASKYDDESTNPCLDDATHHPTLTDIAGHTPISIQVRLAPSCRKCCLIIEIGTTANATSSYPSQLGTTSDLTHANLFRGGIVSWDGDDESRDGNDDNFELKDQHGGRKKRVMRSQEQSTRQTRTRRRIRRDSIERRNNKDDIDDGQHEFKCVRRRGRSRHRMAQSLANLTRRRRRMRHDDDFEWSESDSAPSRSMHTTSPRHVTDVSDCPSSDEEGESNHTSSNSYNRSCSSSSDVMRMKVGTIITQLSAGLPEVAVVLLKDASVADESNGFKILSSNVQSMSDVENDYLDQPIGDVVREYSREKTIMSTSVSGVLNGTSLTRGPSRRSTVGDFVLTLADMRYDKDACKYHDEVEKLSQWYIETASPIDVGITGGIEPDGGFWKVLYLFEKHSQAGGASKYSLAGYMTLFYRHRHMTVCQALLLPPYQRSGHGTDMLRTAYEACDGREILVESPAPAFGENEIRFLLTYSSLRTLTHSWPISQLPCEIGSITILCGHSLNNSVSSHGSLLNHPSYSAV
jgi:hypothetical protein